MTQGSKRPTHRHHTALADAGKSGLTMVQEKQRWRDPKKYTLCPTHRQHTALADAGKSGLTTMQEEQRWRDPKKYIYVQLIVIMLHSPMLTSLV